MENDSSPNNQVEYDEPSYPRYNEEMEGCRRLFLGALVFTAFMGGIAIFALLVHFLH